MTCAQQRTLTVCIALIFSSSFAHAVDWDGLGDGTTWNDPGNWDTGVPGGTDSVFINDNSINGGSINFDFGQFGDLTIGGPTVGTNNMGAGLTLDFSSANQGNHFALAGGTLTVKAGTGAVTLNNTNFGPLNLNSGNITVEEGVTGDFMLGTGPTNNPGGLRLQGPLNGNLAQSTFTNNSDQNFIITVRNSGGAADPVEFTLHSSINGDPGNFTLPGHSIGPGEFRELTVTGDAHVEINRSLGSDGGSNVGAARFATDVNTEVTNSTATTNTLTVRAADTVVAGRITGNLNLDIGLGNSAAIRFTNDDTYTGTTELGSGSTNANRAVALIRDGSHVGGADYTIIGGLRGGRDNDAVLGGSGQIHLQDGAVVLLERPAADVDSPQARATLAPGNTGFDPSGVDKNTGVVGQLSLGNQGIGTLTVSADEVIFGDYSRLEVQLNGPDSDLLNILAGTGGNTNAGNLDLSSALNELFIDADLLGDANGDVYTLLSWEGSRVGEFDQVWLQDGGALIDQTTAGLVDFLIDGFEYDLVYGPNSLQLVGPNVASNAVPEPASIAIWSLLGLAIAGLGILRRQRKQ